MASAYPTSGPAVAALREVTAKVAVGLRGTWILVGGTVALAGAVPPLHRSEVVAAVAVFAAWAAIFAWRGRQRLPTALVAVDLALCVAACLLMGRLVAPGALAYAVSWVAVLASTSLIIVQLAWPARLAVPCGLAVTASYAAGARLASAPDDGLTHTWTLLIQTVLTAAVMALIRRAGAAADVALTDYHEGRARAIAEQARRADERRLNRDLHDTALATLAVVGLGGMADFPPRLRARAAHDLAVLDRLSDVDGSRPAPCRLDERLRSVVDTLPDGTHVRAVLPACTVPVEVADGIADSAVQALANVVDHAGTAAAELTLCRRDGRVVVEIVDSGRGFDTGRVPAHRYGLRESILGRMAAIGGRAEVVSAVGQGTRVTLEWSDG